ncbi:histidine kinase [Actinomycetospora sp. SF1]|nr:histidine kinase [Actinomycetospora soli]
MRDARDRLAAEVHDHTVQRLFALGLALDAVAATDARVRERLDPLVDELDETVRELRALVVGLVPTSVPEDGAAVAGVEDGPSGVGRGPVARQDTAPPAIPPGPRVPRFPGPAALGHGRPGPAGVAGSRGRVDP